MFQDKSIKTMTNKSQELDQSDVSNLSLSKQRELQLKLLNHSIEQLQTPTSLRSKTRNTKSLIGLLITHGARAKRATLPKTGIKVHCHAPNGRPALNFQLG